MIYLLDNNIISYFLHARREDDLMEAAKQCSLAIAEEVEKELRRDHRDGARFRAWLAGGAIQSLPILVDSEVDRTYQRLQPPMSGRGKGERASIALAAHDASLVFVANDRNAMWLALAELHHQGERMIGIPVFLRRMHEEAGLAAAAVDAGYRAKRPTWWAEWRVRLGAVSTPV